MIFSIAVGANYSFYVKTIETHERAFLALNILAIGRVSRTLWFGTLLKEETTTKWPCHSSEKMECIPHFFYSLFESRLS